MTVWWTVMVVNGAVNGMAALFLFGRFVGWVKDSK